MAAAAGRDCPRCWRSTAAAGWSRSRPATRSSPGSAPRWPSLVEDGRGRSRRCRRSRSPEPGCGGRRSPPKCLTLVGRDVDVLRRELAPGRRLLVLSSDETTPAVVAELLREEGLASSRMTVLGDLGSPTSVGSTAPPTTPGPTTCRGCTCWRSIWSAGRARRRPGRRGCPTTRSSTTASSPSATSAPARSPGSRRVRAPCSGTSARAPARSRSSGCATHPTTEAVAVEADPERAARIVRNAARLGVPRLRVVTGRAPEALAGLAGTRTRSSSAAARATAVHRACAVARSRPGGRLVAHGVTLETEQLLLSSYQRHGGELTRIAVEHAAPLGSRHRLDAPAHRHPVGGRRSRASRLRTTPRGPR